MPERIEPVLKIACLLLAGLVVYQLIPLLMARDPVLPGSAPPTTTVAPNPQTSSTPGNKPIPPAVATRIEQITQSEIFGPIPRPLPMGLIGIFGDEAYFRAPNGQVGWLKEGDELGGVKLIRIGTNRILIEHEGQTSELTIFGGFGGESLRPQETAQ
jgi:hypothetical protein